MLTDPLKQTLVVTKISDHSSKKGWSLLDNTNGKRISVDPSGNVSEKETNWDGTYETCKVNGNMATYHPDGNKVYSFLIEDVSE